MENEKIVNPSIGCSVTQCAHHCKKKQYCSLDKISVAKQTENVSNVQQTICGSFECDSDNYCH